MNMYDESEIDPVLRQACSIWLTKIVHAKKHKETVFGLAADECRQFYNGPKDWSELMGNGTACGSRDGFPSPDFQISVNKTFEFVTIFGPALYYENPVRTAKPRMPVIIPQSFFPDPTFYQAVIQQENQRVMADGLRGLLIESMLNWSPNDFDLSGESRSAIDEALITGRGCMWTELYQPPGVPFRTVRSSWESVDDLLIDPDAKSVEKATWIARRCSHPVWQVEKDFGLRHGSLKGTFESMAVQADISADADRQTDRQRGLTNDLLTYYKIYSKMGIGGRLQGVESEYQEMLEIFGDYAYIVVAEGCPFPLNLPPEISNDKAATREIVFGRTAWPTPFWAAGAWPVSILDFHPVHNCAWPLPHLKAGIGELKCLNWFISLMASKLRTTCRDIIAVKKGLSDEIKETILHGKDLELLELEADHPEIQKLVQVLQFNPVNADIWHMIKEIEDLFDKRVGLTELMYGSSGSTQIRSASEANVRNQNMNVRPEDMGRQVEAWQSKVGMLEALCLRWHLHGTDVTPILGPIAAMAWDQYVTTKDLAAAAHQLEYRIEAGSTKRPNKDTQNQQITQALQAIGPMLLTYFQQTGDATPLNNLLAAYAKSQDLDQAQFQLTAPIPPPAPPTAPGEGGPPGDGPPKQAPPGQAA